MLIQTCVQEKVKISCLSISSLFSELLDLTNFQIYDDSFCTDHGKALHTFLGQGSEHKTPLLLTDHYCMDAPSMSYLHLEDAIKVALVLAYVCGGSSARFQSAKLLILSNLADDNCYSDFPAHLECRANYAVFITYKVAKIPNPASPCKQCR